MSQYFILSVYNGCQYLNDHSIANGLLAVNMANFGVAIFETQRLNFLMYCLHKAQKLLITLRMSRIFCTAATETNKSLA